MKRLSTTLVSKGLATKSTLVACAVLMAVAGPLSMMPKANADQYDDQINALQQQANQYQAAANEKQKQADTLANKLQDLANQKASVQTQIDLSQAQYNKLQDQIKQTEQKISDNKDALGSTIADLYVDNTISPLEMLASSKNIGDYVDKQTYQSSIQDTLTKTISTIKDLKTKLEGDKAAVKDVLDKQNAQKNSLVAIANQQQQLLDKTKGEEAAYQTQAAAAKTQLESVSAQQRAFYESLVSHGGASAGVSGDFQYSNLTPSDGGSGCGGGGYPLCGPQDSYADQWGLYNRECVSYVAWALVNRFGKYVGHFGGAGNAYEWPSTAPRTSGAVRVYDPQPGDAVILPQSGSFAPIGHAMVVESVNGSTVHVSQYNFYGSGAYSSMDIQNSGVIYLRFPNA